MHPNNILSGDDINIIAATLCVSIRVMALLRAPFRCVSEYSSCALCYSHKFIESDIILTVPYIFIASWIIIWCRALDCFQIILYPNISIANPAQLLLLLDKHENKRIRDVRKSNYGTSSAPSPAGVTSPAEGHAVLEQSNIIPYSNQETSCVVLWVIYDYSEWKWYFCAVEISFHDFESLIDSLLFLYGISHLAVSPRWNLRGATILLSRVLRTRTFVF